MVDTLKDKIMSFCSKYDEMYGHVYICDGLYVLKFSRKLLEDGSSTLDKCGIMDEGVLQLRERTSFPLNIKDDDMFNWFTLL